MRLLSAGLVGGLLAAGPLLLAPADAVGAAPLPAALVAPADLAALPPVVRRYFDFMGVAGRPWVWSVESRYTGRFRLGRKGAWQPCHGRARNRRGGAYRDFEMRMATMGFLPLVVHDAYQDGAGGFQAKLLGLFTVAEARGPALDLGELVTYLSEGILWAPSLLLGPETQWRDVDDHAFEVTLTDAGTTVTGRVDVDGRGAPVRFSTTDRFFVDPTDAKQPPARTPWRVEVTEWASVESRAVAIGAQAAWELPEGPYPYGEVRLEPSSVRFNAPFPD